MNRQNKEIEKEFFSTLRDNQVALNPEVEKVAHFFFARESHFTLQDIEAYSLENRLEVPGEIIQRMLQLLLDFGFARARTFEDGLTRYEHLHLNEHHDHFFCIRCKNIIEFSSKPLEEMQDAAADEMDFHPFWHKLEIYGLCNECFSKSKGTIFSLPVIQQEARVEIVEIKSIRLNKGWMGRVKPGSGLAVAKRIKEMGLVKGTRARVVSNTLGMVVLDVNGQRIALGKEMSQCVLVKLVE